MSDWKQKLESEFARAEQARREGKEGQARVCARRAAGIAIREYLTKNGKDIPSDSAYEMLKMLVEDTTQNVDVRQSALYLTLRVTEEFKLPMDIDLISEARRLCDALLA